MGAAGARPFPHQNTCCGQFTIPVGTEGGPCLASVARGAADCPQPCFSLQLFASAWTTLARGWSAHDVFSNGCFGPWLGVWCTFLEACGRRTRVAQGVQACMGPVSGRKGLSAHALWSPPHHQAVCECAAPFVRPESAPISFAGRASVARCLAALQWRNEGGERALHSLTCWPVQFGGFPLCFLGSSKTLLGFSSLAFVKCVCMRV